MPLAKGQTRVGRREKLFHDDRLYHFERGNEEKEIYRCSKSYCRGRIFRLVADGSVIVRREHVCEPSPLEKAKDEAMNRLRKMILEAGEGDKAITIVDRFLQEISPEVRAVLANEESLAHYVNKWAKAGGIALNRTTTVEDNLDVDTPFPSELLQDPLAITDLKKEPGEEEEGKKSDLSTVKMKKRSRKRNGRGVMRLVNEEERDMSHVDLDNLRTAQEDCSQFPLDHDNASYQEDDDIHPAGGDGNLADSNYLMDDDYDDDDSDFSPNFDSEPEPGAKVQRELSKPELGKGSTLPKTVLTSSTGKRKSTSSKTGKDAVAKNGEKCHVCGDDLVLTETLSSSEETFRKACRYLNVKSSNEWFPRMSANGQFYSFCQSCTKEVLRIHELYKKVEEIQSLIFKKVEHVEERIAKAEIVDNWMAEVPTTSAKRFEGFRKQVLINYRNKLRLRREIRVGAKMGHSFTEVQPVSSARMFATDPTETDAFRRIVQPLHQAESESFPKLKRGRGRPSKSKKNETSAQNNKSNFLVPTTQEENTFGGQDDFSGGMDHDSYDGDGMSDAEPAREVKFWEEDPSQLQILNDNEKNNATENNKEDDDINDDNEMGVDDDDDGASGSGSDSDPDYVDSTESKTKKSAGRHKPPKKGTTAPRTSSRAVKGNAEKATSKSTAGRRKPSSTRLPSHQPADDDDTTLTQDGRVFLSGIEIIKNSPGLYTRYSTGVSYTCSACDKIMCSFANMKEHIAGQHLGQFTCPSCGKQFTTAKSLSRHVEWIHSEKAAIITPCPICQKPISGYPKNMLCHRWTHLSEEEKNDPQYQRFRPSRGKSSIPRRSRVMLQTFMCTFCSKTFCQTGALRRHEMIHTGEGPTFQCQFCGKLCPTKSRLTDHSSACAKKRNRGGEGEDKDNPNGIKKYPCPKCTVRFKSKATRNKHFRRFHENPKDKERFPCPKCSRSFSTKGGFITHRRMCIEGRQQKNSTAIGTKSSRRSRGNRDPDQRNDNPTTPTSAVSSSNINMESSNQSIGLQESASASSSFTSSNAAGAGFGFGYNLFGSYPGGSC